MQIRDYKDSNEEAWLFCRNVSLMNTAYFDDIYEEKEKFKNDAVELVAEIDHKIVGILDAEIEQTPGQFCSSKDLRSAMIWSVGVLKEHRRKGIAKALFDELVKRLKKKGIKRIEAWTRDDIWVREWYEKMRFKQFQSYYHVYIESNEALRKLFPKELDPVTLFGHCDKENIGSIKEMYNVERMHECVGYEYIIE